MRKGKVFSSGKIEGVHVCLFSVGVKTVGFHSRAPREGETPVVRVFSHPSDFFLLKIAKMEHIFCFPRTSKEFSDCFEFIWSNRKVMLKKYSARERALFC